MISIFVLLMYDIVPVGPKIEFFSDPLRFALLAVIVPLGLKE